VANKPETLNYGNSFGRSPTRVLSDYKPTGDINPDELNTTLEADGVEFNKFEQTINDFVLARLGHPVVRVELTPYQIKTCIDEAITKLEFHAPLWTLQFATFKATAGQNVYELPRYVLNNIEYVTYKKTLLTIQSQAGTLEFDFFIKYFQDNFLMSNFSVGDFYLLQQNLEMMRKVLSQEGSWNVVDNKFLQIYPMPVMNDTVIVQYRSVNSETIQPAYRNFIQKYAVAVAKTVLGQVRGKYTNLPSPGGGATLNGAALIQEGTQEMTKLEEELRTELEEPPTFTCY
tara:strand:+ start:363 stop:1223 length:861 start_codon:yes stop_codon:yes gene_type:complete